MYQINHKISAKSIIENMIKINAIHFSFHLGFSTLQ